MINNDFQITSDRSVKAPRVEEPSLEEIRERVTMFAQNLLKEESETHVFLRNFAEYTKGAFALYEADKHTLSELSNPVCEKGSVYTCHLNPEATRVQDMNEILGRILRRVQEAGSLTDEVMKLNRADAQGMLENPSLYWLRVSGVKVEVVSEYPPDLSRVIVACKRKP